MAVAGGRGGGRGGGGGGGGGARRPPTRHKKKKAPARVVGGAALLFHDRPAALAALRGLSPPGSPAAMDLALWLTEAPDPAATAAGGGRGAWLWWAGVDPRARRAGVGASLVAAAEVAAAAAGVEALYVQALADPAAAGAGAGSAPGAFASLLPWASAAGGDAWRRRRRGGPDKGAPARGLYRAAGYTPLPPPGGGGAAAPWWGKGGAAVDGSAEMLGKWLGGGGRGRGGRKRREAPRQQHHYLFFFRYVPSLVVKKEMAFLLSARAASVACTCSAGPRRGQVCARGWRAGLRGGEGERDRRGTLASGGRRLRDHNARARARPGRRPPVDNGREPHSGAQEPMPAAYLAYLRPQCAWWGRLRHSAGASPARPCTNKS